MASSCGGSRPEHPVGGGGGGGGGKKNHPQVEVPAYE